MNPKVSDQTYMSSVVFLDIVQFSQQSNAVQSTWRIELASLLERGMEGMDPEHRIIIDTGDGAAIAFLLHPEEALSFLRFMHGKLLKLQNFSLRVGAHLGSFRVVQGMNGQPNILGDGINAAQRVMGFAGDNEALVSKAFYEAVTWLSTGNSSLFSPYGKQADKHGREHDLFQMGSPPASQRPMLNAMQTDLSTVDAPQSGKSSGFTVKAGLGAALALLVVGVLLWTVVGNREFTQTPPSVVKPAEPGSTIPASAAIEPPQPVPSPPATAKPERARPAILEKPRNGSDICPNCSCTDLRTNLSLSIPLKEKELLYMNEYCKQ